MYILVKEKKTKPKHIQVTDCLSLIQSELFFLFSKGGPQWFYNRLKTQGLNGKKNLVI